ASVVALPLEVQDAVRSVLISSGTAVMTELTELPYRYREDDTEKLQYDLVLRTDKRDSQQTALAYDVNTKDALANTTATGSPGVRVRQRRLRRRLRHALPRPLRLPDAG